MRSNTLAALTALALVTGGAALGDEPRTAVVSPLTGTYLEDHYIEVLKRTHSPMTAGREDMHLDVTQEVIVEKNDRADIDAELVFGLVINWHEGMAFFLGPQGDLLPVPPLDSYRAEFRLVDREHFQLAISFVEDKRPPRITGYSYVGDEKVWLNSVTLAGRYQDEAGRTYIFQADGHAELDGIPADFWIINEPVFNEADFVQFKGPGRIPGSYRSKVPFRREGDTLTWYASVSSPSPMTEGVPDYERPILRLDRLSD